MKVPYAKKWQKETEKLRQTALDCGLTEELKWGKPCFTFLKKNVAIVIPLKESCALSFFKGALLKDPKHVLERIGEHTRAGRWIKFTSLREIAGPFRSSPASVGYLVEPTPTQNHWHALFRSRCSGFCLLRR